MGAGAPCLLAGDKGGWGCISQTHHLRTSSSAHLTPPTHLFHPPTQLYRNLGPVQEFEEFLGDILQDPPLGLDPAVWQQEQMRPRLEQQQERLQERLQRHREQQGGGALFGEESDGDGDGWGDGEEESDEERDVRMRDAVAAAAAGAGAGAAGGDGGGQPIRQGLQWLMGLLHGAHGGEADGAAAAEEPAVDVEELRALGPAWFDRGLQAGRGAAEPAPELHPAAEPAPDLSPAAAATAGGEGGAAGPPAPECSEQRAGAARLLVHSPAAAACAGAFRLLPAADPLGGGDGVLEVAAHDFATGLVAVPASGGQQADSYGEGVAADLATHAALLAGAALC